MKESLDLLFSCVTGMILFKRNIEKVIAIEYFEAFGLVEASTLLSVVVTLSSTNSDFMKIRPLLFVFFSS